MATSQFILDQFAGLRPASDSRVGALGAFVATNIDFDLVGRMRNRPGRTYFSSADGSAYTGDLYRLIDGSTVVAGALYGTDGSKLYEIKSSAIASAVVTPNSGLGVDVIVFGTPATGSRVYVSDSNGLRYYSGGAFTNVGATTTPKGGFLTIQPRDARLVCAYSAINATPNPSRVHFSGAGTPETWSTTDFVDLNPGDGEVITGAVTLGDYVIVFKQTRAYVFYGNSTAATGTSVFNYRTVSLGDRISTTTTSGGTLPSGKFGVDGDFVYYVASHGIYRLAAGSASPEQVAPFTTHLLNRMSIGTNCFTCVTADKLYVSNGSSMLVLDKQIREWSTYTVAATALCDTAAYRSAYAFDGTANRLTVFDNLTFDDLGATLSSHYQSVGMDCGAADWKEIKRLWVQGAWSSQGLGTGTLTLSSGTDTALGDFTSAVLTDPNTDAKVFMDAVFNAYSVYVDIEATGMWWINRIGIDFLRTDAR